MNFRIEKGSFPRRLVVYDGAMVAQTGKLERQIGLISLTLYGVGDMLGSGIYGLVGKAAGEMGSAVWLGFLVSMIAAGLTGLSYASLGSRYPRAGGVSYTTYRAFGSGFISYVVGLAVLASGLTSMATASRVFAGYLAGLGLGLPIPLIALLFSLVVAAVVFIGIKESLLANGVLTLVEAGGLILILAVGLPFLGGVNYLDATTAANPGGEIGFSLILSGAVLTFYSFVGFEDMLNVAEEVKEPRRTIPRGLLLALLITSVIYMGVSLVAVSVIPAAELAGSNQPLVDVMKRAAPWFPPSLFSVIAMFAVANTALLNFIMGSRLLFGMSRNGLVPKQLGAVHSSRKTPHRSVMVVWVLMIVLIFSGDISSLAKATSVLLLTCFTLVNAALFVLQRKEKIEGSFEIPSFVPVLGAIVCVALLTKAQSLELTTAAGILALIVILYFIMKPKARDIEAMDEIEG